jgi:tetratricopeptide (TPR) repeat protein
MFSLDDISPQGEPARDIGYRLNSWKEIARYLRREVRTVQLWEKHEGLPVRRHFHTRQGSVFALRDEIDAWRTRRAEVQPASVASKSDTVIVPIIRHRIAVLADLTQSLDCLAKLALCLDLSKVEILADCEGPLADLILRQRCVQGKNCLELFSNPLQMVIWSHVRDPDLSQDNEEQLRLAHEIHDALWLHAVSNVRFNQQSRVHKPAAREAYARGRYLWNRRTEPDLRKALIWFRTAIWHDPEFALAYTGLADTLTLLCFYEIVSPSEVMPQARQAALRALTLEPNLAEAHTSLADINLHFDRQWEAAGQSFRRAIECNPNYALGYHWYANLLAATGQHDAAYFAVMQALERDPSSLITQVWAGFTCYLARRFDDAIRHYRSALELDQNFPWVHMYMGQALAEKGLFHEALARFDTAADLAGGSNCILAMKAHAYAASGRHDSAMEIISGLQKSHFGKCVPSYDIAATYVALGDFRQALRWLHRACSERSMRLFILMQDPRFDLLRAQSEFQDSLIWPVASDRISYLPFQVESHEISRLFDIARDPDTSAEVSFAWRKSIL